MAQPLAQDFVHGVDLSTAASVSGSLLNQEVDAAVPNIDKGLTVVTTDINGVPQVPNALNITRWQRYLWIRVMSTYASPATIAGCIVYAWSPNTVSDPTYLNWVNVSTIGSAVGGVLTGNLPNPGLALNAVVAANIALKSISNTKLISDAVPGDMLRVQTADDTIVEWFTPPKLFTGLNESSISASANLAIVVNTAGNAYQYATHQMLQCHSEMHNTVFSSTKSLVAIPTTPTVSLLDKVTMFGASGNVVFTPLSTTSTINIELCANVDNSVGATTSVVLALFEGATLLNYTYANIPGLTPSNGSVNAVLTNGALTARTFSVYICGGDNSVETSYMNRYGANGQSSTLIITEYV